MSAPSRLRPALLLAVLASAALSPLTVGAQELRLTAENRRSLILTVYNQNLGLVSETRRVELPAGETVLALEDVSRPLQRSEEHTSELQSLMRIAYAVFCLKKTT